MSPQPRPGIERILDPDLTCRHAGVLVLLYPCPQHCAVRNGTLCLVLTQRSEKVSNHQGQISFPGGSMEPGETAVAAALREAWEELRIPTAALEVIGELSPLYIPHSGFCIHPVVAYAQERPAFLPCTKEVAEVIEVPLAHLLDPRTRQEETWLIHGEPVRVPFYAIGSHKVWGATAMVLAELLALLTSPDAATSS
ncbi:MAG: CoA pyrophosphatase [Anaerolineae bacterium]|nr:CoA pyrophosphatase [Anaerolineae bacterium]MDW8099187.1 CoA pyrophosphatase [Anaerolineae bacterium]